MGGLVSEPVILSGRRGDRHNYFIHPGALCGETTSVEPPNHTLGFSTVGRYHHNTHRSHDPHLHRVSRTPGADAQKRFDSNKVVTRNINNEHQVLQNMDKNTNIAELKDDVRAFCEARDQDEFHDPPQLAVGVSTEVSTLGT